MWAAVFPGSSENTVAVAMSPCSRRNAAAILEVDRGNDQHGNGRGRIFTASRKRKFSSSVSPRCCFSRDGIALRRCYPARWRGKGMRIARHGRGERGVAGHAVVAVHEVEAGSVGDPAPEGVRAGLPGLVPAHVGDLEAGAPRLVAEGEDLARQDGEPGVSPSSLRSKSICADAQTRNGFSARGLPDGFASPLSRGTSCSPAWPPARERRPGRRRGSPRIGGDHDRRLRRHVRERLLHRAEVSHP